MKLSTSRRKPFKRCTRGCSFESLAFNVVKTLCSVSLPVQ
ncbi:Uncharacterised protein [Vibrio cholerae]|nr:Uncharacterised protein [Vibrio cholerae]